MVSRRSALPAGCGPLFDDNDTTPIPRTPGISRPRVSPNVRPLGPGDASPIAGSVSALIRQRHVKRVANGMARKGKRNIEE